MSRKFCAVDAEGDAGARGLVGVALVSAERRQWLTEPDAIRQALLWHAHAGYTFISHNMEYDLGVVWWQLGLAVECISYNRRFNHGSWRYAPKRSPAQLWDSLNLAGGLSLAALGEALNLAKYPTPQRLLGIDPDRMKWRCDEHGTWECLECYAIRDAEIVAQYVGALRAAVEQWGAVLHRRAGSTGVAVWRALDQPAPLRLRDRRSAYLGRRAYFGGRVECFKLGHFAPLYAADVASMYPSVMLESRFPDPASMVTMDGIHPDRVPWESEGAAHVEIAVPHTAVPPLPNEHNRLRMFGSGVQRGYWTLSEIRYARSLGAEVRRVYRATWATNLLSPFTWFVSTLWEARQLAIAAKDPRAVVYKTLLNETYGRFALAGDLAEERIAVLPPGERRSDHLTCRHFPAYGMLMCGKTEPRFFDRSWQNELWAAQITASARIKLHKLLLLQGDNLVYCDTDSVFSMAPIVGLGEGLGQLQGETMYERAWIVGPKMYRLEPFGAEAIARAKGVPQALAEQFLRGEAVWFDRPVSPHQMLEGKGQAGAWHTLTRERRLSPYRRVPVDTGALSQGFGWTPTLAPVFGQD